MADKQVKMHLIDELHDFPTSIYNFSYMRIKN